MKRTLPTILAIGMVVAACGSTDGAAPITTTPTTAEAPRATTSSTTTQPTVTTTTTISAEAAPTVVSTRNLPYHEPVEGANEFLLDVVAPTSEGPHPVVITYHGDTTYNTKSAMTRLAKELAGRGLVVFNATWGNLGRTPADFRDRYLGQPACTYWFAVAHAAEYGGDPSDISLVGFSDGATKAANVAFLEAGDDPGCLAPQSPVTPRTVVLFEGAQGLNPALDYVFREDPDLFEDAYLWTHLDDSSVGHVHLLMDRQTAADPAYSSDLLVKPPTESPEESVSLRDPALVDDIERLGLLDDGTLDMSEVSILLDDHLTAAGVASSMTWIDAAVHTMSDEAMAAIGDLILGG